MLPPPPGWTVDGDAPPDLRAAGHATGRGDRYDAASHLDRDASTYRVNLGVDRQTYEQLFGPAPRQAAGSAVIDTGVDYTEVDRVMPHPFYAPMHWVCAVNPGERSRSQLADLMSRAHALAERQYDSRRR